MKKVFFVKIRFPESAGIAARDALSQIIIRLAAKFSFQGLEDWSVDLKNSKILGAEREFLDLSAFSQRSREMRIFFGKKEDGLLFAKILNDAFSDLKISSPRRLVPQDWMKAWRKHYKTQILREGRKKIAIVPAWKKSPKGLSVRITPGQAFGTGTHPTTQLCLRLYLRHASSSSKVLDFGAGTGVLVISALRAGAIRGVAVESDPVALAQAEKNARLNRCEGIRFLRKIPRGEFDLVFANVLAPVLLEHRKKLKSAVAPGGWIFLSGILRNEAEAFLKGFGAKGFSLVEKKEQGDWAAIALRKKS